MSAILRVLLVTDGTVTRILEAHFQEKIVVEVLRHEEVKGGRAVSELALKAQDARLERVVLLKGSKSGTTYAHAETFAPLAGLAPELRKSLTDGKLGVGELLIAHKLETFREVIRTGKCDHDGKPATERSYLIHLGGKPAFLIREVFPEGAYR